MVEGCAFEVLKIFFVACPPCRSIAASTEIYYQEWGAGMADVEFIEMTNRANDDDADVNGYKEDFGITFPSVSAQGGSLGALTEWSSCGQFG